MNWLQILNNTFAQILAPATLGYALAAIGLSVHFGFAGLLNMGVAGFMAIGAYGFAISILTFGLPITIFLDAEVIGKVVGRNLHGLLLVPDDFGDSLAGKRHQFAFKVTHACFARIVTDD